MREGELMYPMIGRDRGYPFGEADLNAELRVILETIDDVCPFSAPAFLDENTRRAVVVHLVRDHGIEDLDFLLMLDRHHIYQQIRFDSIPLGLMYKRGL